MSNSTDLIDSSETTLRLVKSWIKDSTNNVTLYDPDLSMNSIILSNYQVSTKSVLGTIIYYTGGLLIEDGWLRLVGSNSRMLGRNLYEWNKFNIYYPKSILVADDVIGGFFALNGGDIGENLGNIYYFAPDTLEWEDMEMEYSDFVHWLCYGDIHSFYLNFQWTNWREEVKSIEGNKGVLIYPPLWAEGEEIDCRKRSNIPIRELWELNISNKMQLNGHL